MIHKFTVYGAPRTKKNHGRIVTVRGRPILLPSPHWVKWDKYAVIAPNPGKIEDVEWNVCAVFFREKRVGDAVGYYQGLADLLEHHGIVSNDKWFTSWDGSRMSCDKDMPRVEVILESR